MDRDDFLSYRGNVEKDEPIEKRENVEEFIEKLRNNREELFRQVRSRIEANKINVKAFDSKEDLARRQQEHTIKVSDVILDLILDIFRKANTKGGLIENVDKELGTLAKEFIGEKDSQYNFDENGLTIDLNYTKPSIWHASAERIKNFLDDEDINLKYLDRILATYGVKVERRYSAQDIDDDEVNVDMVTITVDKERPRDAWKQATNTADVKVNTYAYQMLVTLRDSLFTNVENRIIETEERERKVQRERDEFLKQLRAKTDEVADGIVALISDIFYGATKKEAEIDEVDEVLGKLGTDPGDLGKSHYTFDDFGLTVTLNYSHTKERDSYASCFGDFVDWDYLKQQLLERGIEIKRDVHEQQGSLGQKYHHYDTITIKVNELVKNIGIRR
jgi:hypothetical protein